MVGLDELAHLMVASLQRSSWWLNRVSPYGGHELRVLLLRCSLRVLPHPLSHFLSRLLSPCRFPITDGPQFQLNKHAQELSDTSVDAIEALTDASEALTDASEALVATEALADASEALLATGEPVPTGMAADTQTAPGACTTSSSGTRPSPHRSTYNCPARSKPTSETLYCNGCKACHPTDHSRGNRTKLFVTCAKCRGRGTRHRQEAPLYYPLLDSETISANNSATTAKRISAAESFVDTAKAAESFVETDGREPMHTCERVPGHIICRGARVVSKNPRKYSD